MEKSSDFLKGRLYRDDNQLSGQLSLGRAEKKIGALPIFLSST